MMESDPLLGGDNCDGTDPLFAGPDCCDGVVPSVVLVHWLLGFLPLLLSEHHDDLMFMSIILTAEFAWLVYIASRRTQNTRRRLIFSLAPTFSVPFAPSVLKTNLP